MTQEEAFKLFDELPPPIAERAKRNFDPVFASRDHDSYCRERLARAVAATFLWRGTPERDTFWHRVTEAAEYGTDYPSVKGLPT